MSFYAFKGFDKDLKCRDFQYEVGKTYSMPEKPEVCVKGFHCCTKLSDVFLYYPPWTWVTKASIDDLSPIKRWPLDNRYCLVKVCGDIDTEGVPFGHSSKIATNSITIIRELDLEHIINILEGEVDETKREYISIKRISDELMRVHQPERNDVIKGGLNATRNKHSV